MEQFNLEYQYRMYLRKSNLSEDDMPEVQKVETKRAFMAGCSALMVLMSVDLPQIKDDKRAVLISQSLLEQGERYWMKERESMASTEEERPFKTFKNRNGLFAFIKVPDDIIDSRIVYEGNEWMLKCHDTDGGVHSYPINAGRWEVVGLSYDFDTMQNIFSHLTDRMIIKEQYAYILSRGKCNEGTYCVLKEIE